MKSTITREEVFTAQKKWGEALVSIGKAFKDKEDYRTLAENNINTLYAYDITDTLFKPTLASEQPLHLEIESAVSYFVGKERQADKGFALKPWSNVIFGTQSMSFRNDCVMTMGIYTFIPLEQQQDTTNATFTFGYIKDTTNALRIFVHHSSLLCKEPERERSKNGRERNTSGAER